MAGSIEPSRPTLDPWTFAIGRSWDQEFICNGTYYAIVCNHSGDISCGIGYFPLISYPRHESKRSVGLLEPHLTYARECVIHHTSGMSIQARLIYPKDLWLFWEYTTLLLGVISMTLALFILRQECQWESILLWESSAIRGSLRLPHYFQLS